MLTTAKAKSQGLSLGISSGWQGSDYLNYHRSLPGFAVAGSWSQQPQSRIEPRHARRDTGTLLIMGCIGHCPRLHRSFPQPWVTWTDLHCQHLYLFLSLKAPSLGTAYMQTQSHSASRVMSTKHIHDSVPHLPHWRCCRFTM